MSNLKIFLSLTLVDMKLVILLHYDGVSRVVMEQYVIVMIERPATKQEFNFRYTIYY